ncbi:hydantoinase B/oxoprolinase family protein [Saliphagus sp. GCM10025308]
MSDKYDVDPVTQEVVGNYLRSTANEMGVTMMRTAYSSILIAKDFSTGVFDADANIVGQADYVPIHIASMQYSVEWAVEEIGRENLEPGDMLMHNDPFRGGTHIADHTVIRPVFDRETEDLIAFTANRAHQIDLGGMSAGGFAGDATDAYQEGIRVPPVKIWEGGEERRDLWKFMLSNVRIPKSTHGDMRAQIASNLTGERRIYELIDRYDRETFEDACAALRDHSERLMRSEIEEIPDGTYRGVDYMDDDGITDNSVRIEVEVTVDGSEIIFDFEGTDEQTDGPINCPWTVTAGGVYIALYHLTDPNITFNEGCFRPVHILVPPGTVLNANHPAATFGGNTETSKRVIDAIIRAFADALPERVTGANIGTSLNFTGGGSTETHGNFAFYMFIEGGWGGRSTHDGISAAKSQISNTKNQPIEILERKYPFLMRRYGLREDSEGPGEYRGGLGVVWEMELAEGEMSVNALADRVTRPPWGVHGGDSAAPNEILLQRSEDDDAAPVDEREDAVSPSKFSNVALSEGDVVSIRTAGGGGYGDPTDRDIDAVLRDVERGYVSPERAQQVYGVDVEHGERVVSDGGTDDEGSTDGDPDRSGRNGGESA